MDLSLGHPAHSARPRTGLSLATIRNLRIREGHAVIRIEIGAMPPLLRSIVNSALGTEGDLVVMEPAAIGGRRAGSPASGADVIIVCSDRDPDDCIPIRQLAGTDTPAIVAIDSAGATATILRVIAESTPIAAASDLCDAVRLAARDWSRTTN
jgi:hypothetical protein